MPANRSRKEARQRVIQAFMTSLDQILPEDESVPLKGRTFREFETQAQTLKAAVIPTLLEERAGLDASAHVATAGRCPHCGSDRTYLEAQSVSTEVRSPDGPVVLDQQHARCR